MLFLKVRYSMHLCTEDDSECEDALLLFVAPTAAQILYFSCEILHGLTLRLVLVFIKRR